MTEISPTIMVISSYSLIAQKVMFLANAIADEESSNSKLINIECFTVNDREKGDRRVVRLSSDDGVWVEVSPLHEYSGDILPKNVAVNLYDFFNILDNCKDELLSFWIDEEDNELVINSFYNEDMNCDELEVRMPIHSLDFPPIDRYLEGDSFIDFELNPMEIASTVRELNNENQVDDIHFVFSDEKLTYWSLYNGLTSKLEIKESNRSKDVECMLDYFAFKIPFRIYNLMASTGQVTPIKCSLYQWGASEYIIKLTANEYHFLIKAEPSTILTSTINDINLIDNEDVENPDCGDVEKLFMINVEDFNSMIQLVNRISKSAPLEYGEIVIEKVNDAMADFTLKYPGHYEIGVRLILAMLVDENYSIRIDSHLFEDLLTKSGVDAISVYRVKSTGDLFIKYENAIAHKTLLYKHDVFIESRKD